MRLERAIEKHFVKKRESKKVKKIPLIGALAMTVVLAFAMSASAAQPLVNGVYQPTANPNQNLTTGPSTAPAVSVPMNADGSVTKDVTRIHSSYTKNTNACAACHATHTAVGASLLQWNGETTTCMACHDGTAGVATYDVAGGHIGASTAITNGGVFPTGTQTSVSQHDVFGNIMQLKAAPGGNTTAQSGSWMNDFSCASCHSPHDNGGNFRLLNPDVNGFATNHTVTKQQLTADPDNAGGYALKVQYNTVNSTNPFYAYLLQGPYPIKLTVYDASGNTLTAGQDYTFKVVNDHTSITPTTNQTLYVSGDVALKVKGNIKNYLSTSESVQYVSGFNDFCGACHVDYNTSMYSDTNGVVGPTQKTTDYYDNYGNQIKVASHAVDQPTGVYTQAYRHTVGFDAGANGHGGLPAGLQFEERTYKTSTGATISTKIMSCMTCHVAHGTDDAWWQAYGQKTYNGTAYNAFGALPKVGAAPAEVFDASRTDGVNNRGSNLKRLPNMGACEACHDKADGAAGYNITSNAY